MGLEEHPLSLRLSFCSEYRDNAHLGGGALALMVTGFFGDLGGVL